MRFSLKSRFRGAFLGTALGQVFAAALPIDDKESTSPENLLRDRVLHPALVWQSGRAIDPALGQASRQAVQLTRRLVEPQPFSQAMQTNSPSGIVKDLVQTDSAIGFLPLMLFCHESQEQLEYTLMSQYAQMSGGSIVSTARQSEDFQSEALWVGAIVSLMLQEQFLPDYLLGGTASHQLIPRLLEGRLFPSIQLKPEQVDELRQIQSWLVEGIPVSMLATVSLSPVAASLYSFLKMPASFSLALRHTLRLKPDPTTAALTGLFAGAHLSEAGLPIAWRNALDRYQSATLKALWDVESIAELLELADRLWAVWSGAFLPQHWQPSPSTITAMPRLVRPR